MSKSRSDQMVERLRAMQIAAPEIEASAVVSVDGLIMASALPAGSGRRPRLGHVGGEAESGRAHCRRVGARRIGEGDNGFIVLTSSARRPF